MIAACPKCGARYRIDKERLPAEGARLRCSRCEAVFRVSPPATQEPARVVVPVSIEQQAAPPPAADREKLVLIADPEMDTGKSTAQALSEWGLDSVLVHDGVEAILTIQRMLPRAVILDAALPKMFGFQVCELMKRNESLRGIHVVLIGAIHDRERYRRPPTEFYGADAYVERHNLPDALRGILAGFGLGPGVAVGSQPVTGAKAREESVAFDPPVPRNPMPVVPPVHEPPISATQVSAPVPIRPAPVAAPPASRPASEPVVEIPRRVAPVAAPAADAAGVDPEVQKAERLARIVVSDIVLYNEEKFAAAVRSGNVLEVMAGDMHEGRALLVQRIAPRVRESRDFLAEEIVRVARQRGMK